jgi:WD40 repeat protein
LSPDGRWIEASNAEGVFLLEVATGRIAGKLPPNSERLAFGSDGSIAFITGHDIFIWKWNEAKAEFEETQTWNGLHNRGREPRGLSFGANGEHLSATGPRGNFVTIWEVATGKRIETTVAVQAYTASMNPTASQVAHPIHNGHIRVWNYRPQYDNLTTIPIVHGMARFSPNGKLIAVADDNLVSIRDVVSGRVVRSINGRLVDCETPDKRDGEPWVFDQQQPDHSLIVVYNKQASRLEVWGVDQGKPVKTSQSVYDKEQIWFYVSNDGRRVTTIEKDNQNTATVRVWNIQTGETSQFATPSFYFHTVWENRLAFNDQIWDTQRGVEIFKDSSMVYPRSMRFCGNGKRFFRGGYGGVLSLYDIHPNGQPDSEPKQFTGHGGEYDLHYLVLSPDETKLLASDDGAKFQGEVDRAILWDIETALPLMTFEGEAEDWSSDNKHIALSTAEGVRIWTLPPSR